MTPSPPYRAALDEVVAEILPGGRVTRTRRLRGGLGSLMHAVDVTIGTERVRLSLRRFARPEWGHDARLVRREFRVLAHLHDLGLAVPEPVWMDPDGGRFGMPALLLRYVAGAPVLDPTDVRTWAAGLASSLRQIHEVDPGPVAEHLPDGTHEERLGRLLEDPTHRAEYEGPHVDAAPLLATVRELLGGPTRRRLIHGDFHAGNVLWSDGAVTATIDWSGVGMGDPRFDVAYLRLDTTLLLGEDAGDEIVEAYEEVAGPLGDLAPWDIYAATMALPDPARWLPGYIEQGRDDLDEEIVRRRLRRFIARAEAHL